MDILKVFIPHFAIISDTINYKISVDSLAVIDFRKSYGMSLTLMQKINFKLNLSVTIVNLHCSAEMFLIFARREESPTLDNT